MSLRKQDNKSKSKCKVTFTLSKELADHVNLVGDFNNWDENSIRMKKTKRDEFSASIELERGREYQFRYLINGKDWVNELEADKHVQNVFQSENSVVIV